MPTLLTSSDPQYIGSFELPNNVGGLGAADGRGLTHRYVGGELRFFSATVDGNTVYEVSVPALRTTPPYNVAPLVRHWGDVFGEKRWIAQANVPEIWGLFWDPVDQVLYGSYGAPYDADGNEPSLVATTLNDATGVASPIAAWGFTGRGDKATRGGVLPIPAAYASSFGGRRLGVGFGGIFSVATAGPIHAGPALAAFHPPLSVPDRGTADWIALLGHPFNQVVWTQPEHARRAPDYDIPDPQTAWPPRDGLGYWTQGDRMWQGVAWIDLPDKHGLVVLPTLATGSIWYDGGFQGDGHRHDLWIYDPDEFVLVAAGTKQQHEVQPVARYDWQYPNLTYPLGGWQSSGPLYQVTAASFDATTRRLYVGIRWGGSANPVGTAVHVYQITESAGPAVTRGRVSQAALEVPFAPTRGRVARAELELPFVSTRGRISLAELQVPSVSGDPSDPGRGAAWQSAVLISHRC